MQKKLQIVKYMITIQSQQKVCYRLQETLL